MQNTRINKKLLRTQLYHLVSREILESQKVLKIHGDLSQDLSRTLSSL